MGGYLHPAVYVWTFTTPYWQLWAVLQLRRWLS